MAIASQGGKDLTYFAQSPEATRGTYMADLNVTTLVATPDGPVAAAAWSRQPERLRIPLLLNLSQYEALFGFEGFAVLRDAKRPLEVRVFPDEGHMKYHPRNFAGVYDNNMMWLKFWLKGEEDPRPEFRDQYGRWEAMRARLQAERAVEGDRHDPQ
ncbi:MAG: hypothetical protein WDO68_17185 [Gammaproteobacteria bacterium]